MTHRNLKPKLKKALADAESDVSGSDGEEVRPESEKPPEEAAAEGTVEPVDGDDVSDAEAEAAADSDAALPSMAMPDDASALDEDALESFEDDGEPLVDVTSAASGEADAVTPVETPAVVVVDPAVEAAGFQNWAISIWWTMGLLLFFPPLPPVAWPFFVLLRKRGDSEFLDYHIRQGVVVGLLLTIMQFVIWGLIYWVGQFEFFKNMVLGAVVLKVAVFDFLLAGWLILAGVRAGRGDCVKSWRLDRLLTFVADEEPGEPATSGGTAS